MSEIKDRFIPLCVPEIGGNEWTYVKDCLDTGWVSSVGSYVTRFEEDFARAVGTKAAVATVNGTSAIHIALLVAGVEPDDEVLVSTLTFIAPVNAIRYAGAWPVLIDADASNWQMDPQRALEFLNDGCTWKDGVLRNRETGRRVRAILPVHILGHPVDMEPLLEAARRYGLAVIEDATESLGARYRSQNVGTIGDIACFSFNGNKLLTTGSGGMIATDNEAWAEKARYLTTQAKDDPLEYVHNEIGYNYRLANLLAAMGCAQLERLPEYLEKKRAIAERYREAFASIGAVAPMPQAEWAESAWWLYTIRLAAFDEADGSRALLRYLAARGIQTRPLWQPIHLSPAHSGQNHPRCPVADDLFASCLSLPCSVGLQAEEQEHVIASIRDYFNKAL